MRFQKIDELTVKDHFYLDLDEDDCWYMFNYTAKVGYSYSATNSLISNLKKTVDLKGELQYQYKEQAISQAARYFSEIDSSQATFVPMPPSKIKSDPLYDDRMLRILDQAFGGRDDADIRELVLQINSIDSAHSSGNRPTPRQIEENIKIDPSLAENLRNTLFLVDDVLTTGAHFVGTKRVIQKAIPDIKVIGLFICRRAIPIPTEDSEG